jgi:hypothetical protein
MNYEIKRKRRCPPPSIQWCLDDMNKCGEAISILIEILKESVVNQSKRFLLKVLLHHTIIFPLTEILNPIIIWFSSLPPYFYNFASTIRTYSIDPFSWTTEPTNHTSLDDERERQVLSNPPTTYPWACWKSCLKPLNRYYQQAYQVGSW